MHCKFILKIFGMMHHGWIFALWLLFPLGSYSANQNQMNEIKLVKAIYRKMGGKTTVSMHSVHGVTIKDSMVIEINWKHDGLFGEIPLEIGQLKNLKHLYYLGLLMQSDLSDNQLSGSLPVGISNLVNLEKL